MRKCLQREEDAEVTTCFSHLCEIEDIPFARGPKYAIEVVV